MALLYGFARCLFGVVFLQREARKVTVCRPNSQISPASTNRAPIHHESAKSFNRLLGQVNLLSLTLVMGKAMCFLWEIFFKVFGSGQSDVRSGTSMTTCCVANANIVYSYFQKGCRKKCTWQSRKVLWVIVACASHSPFSPSFQTSPFDRSRAGSQPRQTYGLFCSLFQHTMVLLSSQGSQSALSNCPYACLRHTNKFHH